MRKNPLIGLHDEASEPAGDAADHDTRALPSAEVALGDIAAGDDDVQPLGLELGEHRRQQVFVVLQVAVHDGGIRRGAGENALDARGGKTAPPEPLQAPDVRLPVRQRARDIGGAVGRVVIDEDRLPRDTGEHPIEALNNQRHVFALVERWNDNDEFGHGARRTGRSGRGDRR
jgi:hypothetical protein